MADIDISALSAGLKEQREHYARIFSLQQDNGFGVPGFVVWPVDQKYEIKRQTLGNITQPGGKNRHAAADINNAATWMTILSRSGELAPAKVDLKLDQDEIIDLNNSFMQELGSSNPDDIYSVAGLNYIVDNVFSRIGHEVYAGMYDSALGYNYNAGDAATAFQGGLNLYDGLKAKFDDAVTDTSIGAGQLINKAVSINESNILAELKKIIDAVWANDNIRREMNYPGITTQYSIHVPSEWEGYIIDAIEALTYKNEKTVRMVGENWVPSKLKRTTLQFDGYLDNTGDAFFSPNDNLFMLPKKGKAGADARSATKTMKIEESGRDLQFLIDWDMDVNFADPRPLIIYTNTED